MYKQLLRVFHHLRILLKQQLALTYFAFEPWVDLVNLPVEDEGVEDAEREFDEYPEVVAAGVVGTCHLDEGLDDGGSLEVGGDDVVLLVGSQEGLFVVGKVADEGGGEEREVGKVDDTHIEHSAGEDEGQEACQHCSRS